MSIVKNEIPILEFNTEQSAVLSPMIFKNSVYKKGNEACQKICHDCL